MPINCDCTWNKLFFLPGSALGQRGGDDRGNVLENPPELCRQIPAARSLRDALVELAAVHSIDESGWMIVSEVTAAPGIKHVHLRPLPVIVVC